MASSVCTNLELVPGAIAKFRHLANQKAIFLEIEGFAFAGAIVQRELSHGLRVLLDLVLNNPLDRLPDVRHTSAQLSPVAGPKNHEHKAMDTYQAPLDALLSSFNLLDDFLPPSL